MKRNKTNKPEKAAPDTTVPEKPEKAVSRGRHEQHCTICKHPDRESIEREFIAWRSPVGIAKVYNLSDRSTVYRHAHAFGLFAKRQRNIRAALEKLIERVDEVIEMTGPTIVSAIVAYSKINSDGRFVDRSERVDLNQLFEKMSKDELELYARDGTLPAWFTQTVGQPATAEYSQECENNE